MTFGPVHNTISHLTVEQLEAHARESGGAAMKHMFQLFNRIERLEREEREELRVHLRQAVVEAAGSAEDSSEWARRNPVESQMAMALSAAAWASARAFDTDPRERQRRMLRIVQAGQGVWSAHKSAMDCVSELIGRGEKAATKIWNGLNSAA